MLAIDGGKPVREQLLSYGQQWIGEEDIEAVVDVLKSPFLTQGPVVEQFEQAVADYVGANDAVSFANGTAALHAAYYVAGLTHGDEVITTPITFVATANAALYVGAKPVFADIDGETYNLDPTCVKKRVTADTKAIVSVDFTGQPVDYRALREIADEHGLIFISDGAHSLGSEYDGEKVGVQADMTMFSFHPVKPITTAEGGLIVTDNADYAKRLRLFRSHGVTRENLSRDEGPWYYEMTDLGMNYRLTDLQAALGISQLRKLDSFIERRNEIAKNYDELLSDVEEVITPRLLEGVKSGWHLYMLRFRLDRLTIGRRQLFEALRAENIGVNVHYIPVHTQPYYEQLGYQRGICPIAETWYEAVVTLPLFPKMTDDDITDVVTAVKKVVRAYRR